MIEIYLLKQLTSFAKCGTLSAAAEELHISQPALTRSMKKLEEDLGVILFERQKNRLNLNRTGKLAAEHALRVLEQDRDLMDKVRAYDRSLHTIALGCCAPVPSYELTPRLQQLFGDMTISSDIRSDSYLWSGLESDTYQLIVTHEKPIKETYTICGHEKLFISVPPAHPLAAFDSVSFEDLSGVPFLQYSQVGFWFDLVMQKIPNPHLLIQDNRDTFLEIANNSALPTFFTDYFSQDKRSLTRKIIPIQDPEAEVAYYLVCKKQDSQRFKPLFNHLPDWCLK